MQETLVGSLGGEDPLEKEMATHSSTLAWKIPRTKEAGRLQSMELHRVGFDWVKAHTHNNNVSKGKQRKKKTEREKQTGQIQINSENQSISQSINSVARSWLTLCNPMNHSTPGLPVHCQLPESTQTHVHWLSDAIHPSHPLSSPSPPALNKSSGGYGIPAELFQTLKDDPVTALHSICQHIWKTQQWPQDWKRSVFIPIPKKGNPKECSNHHTIALISHTSKVILKILQARLHQYVNCELPDVQAGFRKGRRTRDQIANICWIIKKEREFQKNIYLCFIDYAKSFVWITTNCGKFWKRWEYQTT